MSVDEILELNRAHNRALFGRYNPLTGEGSTVARVALHFDGGRTVLIPAYMARTELMRQIMAAGSVADYATQEGIAQEEMEEFVHRMRIDYDFEFWAATSATIKDKESGREVRFVLRRAQRKLIKALVDDLFAGRPVRVILLKARQWGGSTLTQLFMAWIQLFHRENWNSVIVTDVEEQARVIRAMYTLMATRHPEDIYPVRFRNFEGSNKNKQLVDRGAVISIGSMQKPDSLRSGDIKMAHLSEVGLWKATKERKPEDVIASILGSVPMNPFTVVVLESTAKGIGNFFHNSWCGATADDASLRSAYTPVFVAWWEIDMYYKEFADEHLMRAFAATLTPREHYYFSLGATLEGLHWYREKRREYTTDWQMCSEFPSDPQEAFQTTGRSAHDPREVRQMRAYCSPPKFIGTLLADAAYGPESIDRSLRFRDDPHGDLYLWKQPDTSRRIANRYVVSLDIGGRTARADWSVISVIDRYPMLLGGMEECIATGRFHLDQDLTIWRAVQMAQYFHNALLVVESNSLDKKGQEGDHSLTILDEIRDYYPNLFYRTDPTKIREGMPMRYGFHTNAATKTDLVTQMNRRIREQLYIERDSRALDEAEWYEIKDDGSYGAVEGKHDDIHMSRMIALKASQLMEPPAEVTEQVVPSATAPVVLTEAAM